MSRVDEKISRKKDRRNQEPDARKERYAAQRKMKRVGWLSVEKHA
ncbi:hypothetical protein [Pseudomonas phage Alpheus]|uniref:Uncharacterized protein n=1 Tax=Pseudomonas phage Alpheus TaxID=2163983 RepID=A0A2S1GMW0_9CAUD|nr:hypothetical protein HOT11_gp08 [Pseudomonas phage Alpheus]AWD90732.1 hypothetical protein [Pseudomonas phage Alpheus]